MNLSAALQEAGIPPFLVYLLIILLLLSVVIFFLTPYLLKFTKKAKDPKVKKIRMLAVRHPRKAAAAVIAALLIIFAGGVYYYFNQPVRTIYAAQLKLEKWKAVQLAQQGPEGRTKANLYFLDVRSRSEYATEHIKESASLPAEQITDKGSRVKLDVVVYSSTADFEEAKKVADIIKKNNSSSKEKYKAGKIYLIRDGFEGLKKSGLATEAGVWD